MAARPNPNSNHSKALKWLSRTFGPNSRCQLCKRRGWLVVDHNHITGMIRGLLCHRCNMAISGPWDDNEWRRAANAYLDAGHIGIKWVSAMSNNTRMMNLGCKFRKLHFDWYKSKGINILPAPLR